MPAHPAAIDLLIETGPLAVSSANKSGQAPPRTAEEAREQLGDEVSVYLDAGPSEGTPSTIVDLTGEAPVLRRVGAVSAEALRDVVSDLVIPDELAEAAGVKPAPTVVDTGSAPSPADDAADAPADQTADDAADETADDPAGDAAGPAADPAPDAAAAAESPAETPIETPAETSAETVLDPQIETPAETPIESSTETPTETPIETTGAVDAEPVPESESAPVTGVSEPAVEEDSASER
jgi:hypothetical protein